MAVIDLPPVAPGAEPAPKAEKPKGRSYWLVIAGLAVGVAMWIIPPPTGIGPNGWHALGLLIPIITIWITEAMPMGIASLLFLTLVVVFQLVKSDVAFFGFTNSLPWLIMGAFVLGAAMEHTGLSKRMSYYLLSRFPGFWGLTAAAYLANIFMMAVPSGAARTGVLAPILSGVLKTIGNPKSSNLSRLLVFNFGGATMSFVANAILTAGAGNIVAVGVYQVLTGHTFTWAQWITIMLLPSVVLSAASIAIGWFLSPPEPELMEKLQGGQTAREEYAKLGPITPDEWKVMGAFALALVLWVFGSVIHLDPGWAAVIVASLLFLPKVGVLTGKAVREINWDNVLLIGAVVSVAGILNTTGVISFVSNLLIAPILNPLSHLGLIGIAIGVLIVGMVAHFLFPGPSNLAMAIPLLVNWGFKTVHLPAGQVLAFLALLSVLHDKNIMFPYWVPPYYVFLSMDIADGQRFNDLLMKAYPFLAVSAVVAAFVAYGLISLTGIGT